MKRERRKITFYEGNGAPFIAVKTNRNDPCKCESGKKAKACCGTETKMHYSKTKKADLNLMLNKATTPPID